MNKNRYSATIVGDVGNIFDNDLDKELHITDILDTLNKQNNLITRIRDLIGSNKAFSDKFRIKELAKLSIGDDKGYWNGVYDAMEELEREIDMNKYEITAVTGDTIFANDEEEAKKKFLKQHNFPIENTKEYWESDAYAEDFTINEYKYKG